MLEDVAEAIEACSEAERAKLARFFAVQAEEKRGERPGASRVLSWLGVVAIGREPHALSLEDIPPDDRRYVRDLSVALEQVVRDQATLDAAETPEDLSVEPKDPVLSVWKRLGRTMEASLRP